MRTTEQQPSDFHLEVRPVADDAAAVVVAVRGEVDIVTAPRLQRALEAAAGDGAATVVADLTAVPFFDSAGLNALIVADGGAAELRVAASRAVLRPMEATGLSKIIATFDSLDAALTAPPG